MSVTITLGAGVELEINNAGYLIISKSPDSAGVSFESINLGLATKKRFEHLQAYLARLSIHAVDIED